MYGLCVTPKGDELITEAVRLLKFEGYEVKDLTLDQNLVCFIASWTICAEKPLQSEQIVAEIHEVVTERYPNAAEEDGLVVSDEDIDRLFIKGLVGWRNLQL